MKIRVVESVLKANDAVAAENRRSFDKSHVLAVNLMSAPGSGKTTLLEKTVTILGSESCAILVGDLQTTRDAERLDRAGAETIQINTGKGCHLSATQVSEGLEQLDLTGKKFLFIENVGNMVCPAGFDLGEHVRAALLSLPEGDDKVAKYWTLFQGADAILLTKMDLADFMEFDLGHVRSDMEKLNTRADFMEISAKNGIGLEKWVAWLREKADKILRKT